MNKNNQKKSIMHFGPDLNEKGGVVTVIDGILKSDLSKKYSIENIATTTSNRKIFTFIKSIFEFINKAIKKEIEIAHIHMASKGSFCRKSIIVLMCKLFNIPSVIHMHGACFDQFYNSMGKIARGYCKYIFKQSEKVIVLSESWKNFFSTWVDEKKIVVVNNSVKVDEKFKIKIKEEKSCVTFVFMGKCGVRKGVYDLLDTIEEIKNHGYDESKFKVILAGDGELDKVNEKVLEKKIENVVNVKGWIEKEEKEEILLSGDVFILPSYNEGLPMAMLEAMSFALPCIVTNVGGIPEVIKNGVNGFISSPGDKKSLYNNMMSLINNEDNRKEMGKNSFDTVNGHFNQEKELLKISNIYNFILKK